MKRPKQRPIERPPYHRRPTAEQVLYVIENFLCEWGDKEHALVGYHMSACWMFTHILLGQCRAHHDWRGVFWKWYRHMKAEEKLNRLWNNKSWSLEKYRRLVAKRPWPPRTKLEEETRKDWKKKK